MRALTPLPTEHQEQHAVVAWAQYAQGRYPQLRLLFAIPNGARTSWSVAKRLKQEGIQAGVPDLCLPVARNGFHGLWLEMKRKKRGRLTHDQRWWHEQLAAQGYLVVTCAGAERAIHWLRQYLGGVDDAGRTLSGLGGRDSQALRAARES